MEHKEFLKLFVKGSRFNEFKEWYSLTYSKSNVTLNDFFKSTLDHQLGVMLKFIAAAYRCTINADQYCYAIYLLDKPNKCHPAIGHILKENEYIIVIEISNDFMTNYMLGMIQIFEIIDSTKF